MNKLCQTENEDYVIYGDTDSAEGSTVLRTSIGDITIAELYDYVEKNGKYVKKNDNTRDYVVSTDETLKVLSYDEHNETEEYETINYVMKHDVEKEMFEITLFDGRSVIVTEDHSVIIYRKDVGYMSVPPREINQETDELIYIA